MSAVGFFNQNNTTVAQPIVPVKFTNAICYGQTGSGKTTGYMLQNIENRIKLNHGILIYDFKGNFHTQVKYLANKYDKLDDICEIGKVWGEEIDILKYSTTKTLQSMFSTSTGIDNNDYWNTSALNLFENLYFLLKNFYQATIMVNIIDKEIVKHDYEILSTKYYPNLKNIADIVKSAKSIKKFLVDTQEKIDYFNTIVKEYIVLKYTPIVGKQKIAKFLKYIDKVNEKLVNLQEWENIEESASNSGNNGVLQVLMNTIVSIASKDCFSNDKFDIVQNLQNSKIIIVDVSGFNDQMLSFFNQSIYKHLSKQTATQEQKQPISIFIDEAHKVLTAQSMPEVDICRENQFEFILATQDRALLDIKVGYDITSVLLKNIVSQYSFKTTSVIDDLNDTTKLEQFEYIQLIDNKQYKSTPIFIDQKELFDVEYNYQEQNDILNLVDIDQDEKYILIYDTELYEEYEIIAYTYDTKKNIITDILLDTNSVDEILNQLNANKNEIKVTTLIDR